MALTLEAANRVRQKTYMFARNPGVYYSLQKFFLHLSTNKGNPDLQIVNVDGTSTASDGSAADLVIANAAGNLFAIYLIQRGTTAVWFQAKDNATSTSKDGTDDLSTKFGNATTKEETLFLYPVGKTLANGLTVSETTTATGAVRTLKANRLDGFIIISGGLGN